MRLKNIIKYTKHMNLLYVEDEDGARDAAKIFLGEFFKTVITAINGQDGLEKYKLNQNKIDIILSDINMPKLNGIQMITEIKKLDKRDIPMIFLSAHGEADYFIKAIELNIHAYILKPLTMNQFLNTLEHIIEKIALKQENIECKDNLLDKEKELNLFKDDIITIFTHELKTPLNAIVAYSDYIRRATHKGELSNTQLKKIASIANKIYTNGIIQGNMIENILEVGKIKANKVTLQKQELNLSLIMQPIIDNYKNAYDKRIDLEIDEALTRSVDEKVFSMIFTNLYSNALKYSKTQLKISLQDDNNGSFILIIEDDGDGIPKELRKRIFDMFEQLDTTVLKREKKGTGIGLFTVKHFAKICNMTITIEESKILGGAKFILQK